MTALDTTCTIHPYFTIKEGNLETFKILGKAFVEKTSTEPGCKFYGFSFDGDTAFCREGYDDAAALLAHLDNVGELLQQALALADLSKLEIHGPNEEIEKLREPLAGLNPAFFVMAESYSRS